MTTKLLDEGYPRHGRLQILPAEEPAAEADHGVGVEKRERDHHRRRHAVEPEVTDHRGGQGGAKEVYPELGGVRHSGEKYQGGRRNAKGRTLSSPALTAVSSPYQTLPASRALFINLSASEVTAISCVDRDANPPQYVPLRPCKVERTSTLSQMPSPCLRER
jgi:hypothetical protein